MPEIKTSEKELSTVYSPTQVEEKWYPIWEKSGVTKPTESGSDSFTLMIPPPNVTGILHIGHVLNITIQDVLVRRARMMSKSTLWLPGMDHASIATEAKVTKMLKKKGINKREIGRDKFLEHAWEWKDKYGGIIFQQLKKLGASCDWDREKFTMDEDYSKAVLKVFVDLYNDGLIYRGERIINWDPQGQTALSEEEVIHKDTIGHLWHFRYPLSDGSGHLVVATTRPETMLGDTGVAVNPKDDRYTEMVGKTVLLPIVNREIPIFADDYVDMEFGTGCVKVTPAHDPNDFDMGERNNLEVINIFHPDAKLNDNVPKGYVGLDRFEARKKVVDALDVLGLLEKIEDYEHSVGHSERTDAVIEPYLSKQWFVKMKPLTEPALKVVKDGDVKIYPERWVKTYNHWLENIKDWCISRQLWWGHRIPVWYCRGNDIGHCQLDCKNPIVSIETPESCPACGSKDLVQDPDVLDTWFSSWLWPFATLGWPEKTEDFKKFYPTQDLVTGPDIIFFWVARMIMAGLYFCKEIPFSNVYFTGIIRDEKGRKMSKSLGNSPDPLDLFEKYGADAVRVSILMIAPQGLDILFSEERLEQGRNFMNKLWNSARFIRMNLDEGLPENLSNLDDEKLDSTDRWILSRLNNVIEEVDNAYSEYKMNEAIKKVYDFTRADFCDWYIEFAKTRFYGDDTEDRKTAQKVSVHVIRIILKLLHPYSPFITEELWVSFKNPDENLLISESWPEAEQNKINVECEQEIQLLMEVITAVRNIRASLNVSPAKEADLSVRGNSTYCDTLKMNENYLQGMAKLNNIQFGENIAKPPQSATAVVKGLEIFVPLSGLIDISKEVERLEKQIQDMEGRLNAVSRKLDNKNFVERAPENVITHERNKLQNYQSDLSKLQQNLESLRG
ncbi:MAG: valine--tRNA ligase [Candidatus Marinimicrobia bacterium]|nr:valine--tRNA ligase [Candidatus Neomarinimicrobiota bacterium]